MGSQMDPQYLGRIFRNYFHLILADNKELRDEVYRMRYAVYCRELHFEKDENYPDGRETDTYDQQSQHCLLFHKPSQQYAGCVRLIMADTRNPKAPFPFEIACKDHLDTNIIDSSRINRSSCGEVSRLAVLPGFRRRKSEQAISQRRISDKHRMTDTERRVFPHISIGLYLAAASIGLLAGLDCVFVMMEPRLARSLRRCGIHFSPVGEIVDYRGMRRPFRITKEALLKCLSPQFHYLLEVIMDDLNAAQERKSVVF